MIGRVLNTTPPIFALAALLAFTLSVARGPATVFVYDAATYWEGSRALVLFGDWVSAGNLDLRGTLTPLVFAPPAALSVLLGDELSASAVLVWNALLLAALGSLALPALLAHLGITHRYAPIVTALLTSGLLGGFAPYPLMDLWATGLALFAVVMLKNRRPLALIVAGLLLGYAGNIRPAMLPLVVLVILAFACIQPKVIWAPVLGVAVAQIPQVLFSWSRLGRISLTPPGTEGLSSIQSISGSYLVRYDTLSPAAQSGSPSQYFCSPSMAEAVTNTGYPMNPIELLLKIVAHPIDGFAFFAQKLGATLLWSTSTPYEMGPDSTFSAFGVMVVTIVSIGTCLFAARIVMNRPRRETVSLLLFAGMLGGAITIVLSASETRFGAPLVAFSIVGAVACFYGSLHKANDLSSKSLVIVLLLAMSCGLLLVYSGIAGLSYPLPPGDGSVESCLLLSG